MTPLHRTGDLLSVKKRTFNTDIKSVNTSNRQNSKKVHTEEQLEVKGPGQNNI